MEEIHECTIPDNIFNKLKEATITSGNNDDCNNHLAGNIEIEKDISSYITVLEPFLVQEIQKSKFLPNYIERSVLKKYNIKNTNTPNLSIELESLWVNFQKKHEFNPIHDHSGVLSFVIFIQVPFNMEEQINLSPGAKSNCQVAGKLCFIKNGFDQPKYVDYPIDRSFEKKCFIFPANLLHLVYPFYGIDLPRITISGNFFAQAKL